MDNDFERLDNFCGLIMIVSIVVLVVGGLIYH